MDKSEHDYNEIEENAQSRMNEMLQPAIGMKFRSEDEAKSFYNSYAKHIGFSIRCTSTQKSRADEKKRIGRVFCCSKQGFCKKKNNVEAEHHVKGIRSGCKAMIRLKLDKSGYWVLSKFREEHNHQLIVPSKVHCLRSQMKLANCKKRVVDTLEASEIGPSESHHVLSEQARGIANVECSKQDIMNYIGAFRKSQLEREDAQLLIKFFEDMHAKDSSFFYQIQVDDEGRLFNVFWVDARCRWAYNHFGDVIRFDTIYLTNKCRMIFASFVGVNHHGQSTLFGCGLLANETMASFVWLFDSFLKAMFGHQPASIITDLDKAMKAAIVEIFPKSCHRFCMWHIRRKFTKNLSHIYNNDSNFSWEFDKCYKESETINEFEASWDSLLTKFDLKENKLLQELHEYRQHWVPACFGPHLFIGMSTVQQSEKIDAFFDGYVNSKTSLKEFVVQYHKALSSRYDAEVHADLETMNTIPKIKLGSPLEEHAAHVYTYRMFKKFQEEICSCLAHQVVQIEKNDEIAKYGVKKYGDDNNICTIVFNANKTRANCSCHKFEDEGILCRHILLLFAFLGVTEIPPHYILDRWTRKARKRVMLDENKIEVHTNCLDSHLLRHNDICRRNLEIAEIGSRSIESYNQVVQSQQELLAKLNVLDNYPTECEQAIMSSSEDVVQVSEADNMVSQSCLRDPMQSVTIVRPLNTRLKPIEKLKPAIQKMKPPLLSDTTRSRTCSTCGQRGHDMRTCRRHHECILND